MKIGKGGKPIGEVEGSGEEETHMNLGEVSQESGNDIMMPDAWESRRPARSTDDMRPTRQAKPKGKTKRFMPFGMSCSAEDCSDPVCKHDGRTSKGPIRIMTRDEETNQEVCVLTRGDSGPIQEVTGEHAGWERISLKIDSGAIDTCLPPKAANVFPLKESEMSKAGVNYRAANGSPIPNYGERLMKGFTDEWAQFALIAQVADVRTPLGSVRSMIQAGTA